MKKYEHRNPLLTGLINVLIPGVSHLYVKGNWMGFIGAFVVNIFILAMVVSLGSITQQSQNYHMPQGACMGTLLMLMFAALFSSGFKVARDSNNA
jgi:hypothetical protein